MTHTYGQVPPAQQTSQYGRVTEDLVVFKLKLNKVLKLIRFPFKHKPDEQLYGPMSIPKQQHDDEYNDNNM